MREIAYEAGQIGMRHFGRATKKYKSDRSIVTEADLEIERFLIDRVASRYPKHGIVAEETHANVRENDSYVWTIDPIDGTQAFASNLPFWSISIGFLVEGLPRMGVIYQPAIGDMYYGNGRSSYLNSRQLLPISEDPVDENSYLMVPESVHNNYEYSWKGDILSLGSVAAHCCYVACGSAVGVLSRAYIWDLVAGVALMEPLDIRCCYLDGGEIDWKSLYDGSRLPKPFLAARRSHWPAVAKCILAWK